MGNCDTCEWFNGQTVMQRRSLIVFMAEHRRIYHPESGKPVNALGNNRG